MEDQWLNILVEWEVLDSISGSAASHVELLVDGFHLLPENVYLLVGEWLEYVLEKAHLVVKRFHLQVTKDDAREVLTGLVGILHLGQFGSASESAGVSLDLEALMFMFHRAGEVLALSEDSSHSLRR